MTEFLNTCGADCHVDEMAIHWYDVKFVDLKAYVDKWAGFGKPLRVTEFACQVCIWLSGLYWQGR